MGTEPSTGTAAGSVLAPLKSSLQGSEILPLQLSHLFPAKKQVTLEALLFWGSELGVCTRELLSSVPAQVGQGWI